MKAINPKNPQIKKKIKNVVKAALSPVVGPLLTNAGLLEGDNIC
jgi:hypothetical protein